MVEFLDAKGAMGEELQVVEDGVLIFSVSELELNVLELSELKVLFNCLYLVGKENGYKAAIRALKNSQGE